MNRQELINLIREKRSYLCVGLDSDPDKIPESLRSVSEDPVFEFNKRIIDSTIDLAVAYKPNLAFYESRGSLGWQSLEKTLDYLKNHPGGPVFTIADAKRGDIGNSAEQYSRAFLEYLNFDSITVNPYMGKDTLKPFLKLPGKWAIVLVLSSNPGASDFQLWQASKHAFTEKSKAMADGHKRLFEHVIEKCLQWGNPENLMFVVGATHLQMLQKVRKLAPLNFFLVPGVGTQGGDLIEVSQRAMNKDCGLLVNASRSIIFASRKSDFEKKAREAAQYLQRQMEKLLVEKKII